MFVIVDAVQAPFSVQVEIVIVLVPSTPTTKTCPSSLSVVIAATTVEAVDYCLLFSIMIYFDQSTKENQIKL